jgi:hypothetical protein
MICCFAKPRRNYAVASPFENITQALKIAGRPPAGESIAPAPYIPRIFRSQETNPGKLGLEQILMINHDRISEKDVRLPAKDCWSW